MNGSTLKGAYKNGVNETTVPTTVAHLDLPSGPSGQFHQLFEASTEPLPRLSIPIPSRKGVEVYSQLPGGHLEGNINGLRLKGIARNHSSRNWRQTRDVNTRGSGGRCIGASAALPEK